MRRSIPAGLLDSGFAALATFSVTIYGSRVMSSEVFGFFALFWAAFLMAAIVPAQLWFQPWEVAATRRAVDERVSLLRRAIGIGSIVALVAAITASGAASAMSRSAPPGITKAFGLSLLLAATLSALQDFVRRMLHVSDRSQLAALVSMAQFGAVILAILSMRAADVPAIWIPFLALAAANAISATLGLLLARAPGQIDVSPPGMREVFRSGTWLVVLGVVSPLAGLVVNWIIIGIAGAAVMGLAESARIVGRPILVMTNGLGLALRPRSFEAASLQNEQRAREIRKAFGLVTLGGALLYTVAVSFPSPMNLMVDLIPKGFEIQGLIPAICLANMLVGLSFPARYELIGSRQEGYATMTEIGGQGLKVLSALGASAIGAFAIPVGDFLLAGARHLAYTPRLRGFYRPEKEASEP